MPLRARTVGLPLWGPSGRLRVLSGGMAESTGVTFFIPSGKRMW